MTLNNYFVDPPADWLFRPHGRVVALLDDDLSLAAALEELGRDQVPRSSVYVLGGADGLEHMVLPGVTMAGGGGSLAWSTQSRARAVTSRPTPVTWTPAAIWSPSGHRPPRGRQ
jgi:hypothetical protein